MSIQNVSNNWTIDNLVNVAPAPSIVNANGIFFRMKTNAPTGANFMLDLGSNNLAYAIGGGRQAIFVSDDGSVYHETIPADFSGYVFVPANGTNLNNSALSKIAICFNSWDSGIAWNNSVSYIDNVGYYSLPDNAVLGISIDKPALTVMKSTSKILTPSVFPYYANNKAIAWSSSNSAIASVDSRGVVSGISAGNATISAITIDGGFIASSTINVTQTQVFSITLDNPALTLGKAMTGSLVATIYPEISYNKNIIWKSDNSSIAVVDDNGLVTGISEGTALITATAQDGGSIATCAITVVLFDNSRYYISTNNATVKTMDCASSSTAAGAIMVQNSFSGINSQQWQFINLGTGYYRITSRNSGLSLDVANVSTLDNANIIQSVYTGENRMQWQISAVGGSYYKISNRNSGKCIQSSGGSIFENAELVQYSYTGTAAQKWSFMLYLNSNEVVGGVINNEIYDLADGDLLIDIKRGSATLNDNLYISNSIIDQTGLYTLKIIDIVGAIFIMHFEVIDKSPPIVFGVINGGTYSSLYGDRIITFDKGTAKLNNVPFTSGTGINSTGSYSLVLTNSYNNAVTLNFTYIRLGDVTGDGKIDIVDLYQVKRHIMNFDRLNGVYLMAGDIYGKGSVTISDLLAVKKILLDFSNY